MTTSPLIDFKPNYATPPGYTLEEWLEENCVKQVDFAARLNMSPKTLNQILRGWAPVTSETARKLEYCTGIASYIWNALEAEYRTTLTRLAEETQLEKDSTVLALLPAKDMRKRGIITSKPSAVVETMREVLTYFQVADVATWHRVWDQPSSKKPVSAVEASFAGALATWFRQGEIESNARDLPKYSPRAAKKALRDLQNLQNSIASKDWVSQVTKVLAEAGVGLVCVAPFQGAECADAIRWFAGRPVIILSPKLKSPAKMLSAVIACLEYVLAHPRTDTINRSA